MAIKSYKTIYMVLLILLSTVTHVQSQSKYPTTTLEPYFDLQLTDAERDSLMDNLKRFQGSYKSIHEYLLTNNVSPALIFDPLPYGFQPNEKQLPVNWGLPKDVSLPTNREELAFYPVYKLATLIKNKKITSVELTKLYLNRLKKFGDTLQCVINVDGRNSLAASEKS